MRPWMALLLVLVLLTAALFGTFFAVRGKQNSPAVERAAASTVTPAVSAASTVTGSIKGFFQRLFGLSAMDKEYEQLKNRVQLLELENQFMQELQKENERLTKLLGFEEKYPEYDCLPARIIGQEPGNWFMNFTLNRGSKDGVEVGMAVVNENALVGRVVEVGVNYSKVMAIIDRNCAVSAIVERSRDNCIVKGSGDPQSGTPTLGVYRLPFDAEIVPGDTVLTTDLGGYYPKGILIGTISEVSRDKNAEDYAVLEPAADFSTLENVLIIRGGRDVPTEDEITNAEQDAASASPDASSTATKTGKTDPTPTPDSKGGEGDQ